MADLSGRKHWERRLRWLDDVVNDLRNVGVRQWRKKTEDRREWIGRMREANIRLKRTVWPRRRRTRLSA
jgi:predicted alpha/beta hydrolase family esterase